MSETREARLAEIIRQMRNEKSRYKSHDLGYVDSVSASSVDEWADELEAMFTPPKAPSEHRDPERVAAFTKWDRATAATDQPTDRDVVEAPPEPPTPEPDRPAARCVWEKDDGLMYTSCGRVRRARASRAEFNYCPYCGQPLVVEAPHA